MSRYCLNCGAELEDDAVFCSACGKKAEEAYAAENAKAAAAEAQEEAAVKHEENAGGQEVVAMDKGTGRMEDTAMVNDAGKEAPAAKAAAAASGNEPAKGAGRSKKGKLIVLGILAAAAVVAALCALLFSKKKQTLVLTDYMMASFTGRDGEGEAVVYIDEPQFMRDFFIADGVKETEDDSFLQDTRAEYDYTTFRENLSFTYDKYKGLSNGDTVTATVVVGENYNGSVNLVCGSKEFEVEGLQEVQLIDPFDETYFNVGEGNDGVYFSFGDPYPIDRYYVYVHNEVKSDNPASMVTYMAEIKEMSDPDGDSKAYRVKVEASLPDGFEGVYELTEDSTELWVDAPEYYMDDISQINEETLEDVSAEGRKLKNERLDTRAEGCAYYLLGTYDIYFPAFGGGSRDFVWEKAVLVYDDSPDQSSIYSDEPYNTLYLTFSFTSVGASDGMYGYGGFDEDRKVYGYISVENLVKESDGSDTVNISRAEMNDILFTTEEELNREVRLADGYGAKVTSKELGWSVG